MPTRPCPECGQTAPRYLPAASDHAVAAYYRCDACAHVFSVPKDQPDAAPRAVMPGRLVTLPDGTDGANGGRSAAT